MVFIMFSLKHYENVLYTINVVVAIFKIEIMLIGSMYNSYCETAISLL